MPTVRISPARIAERQRHTGETHRQAEDALQALAGTATSGVVPAAHQGIVRLGSALIETLSDRLGPHTPAHIGGLFGIVRVSPARIADQVNRESPAENGLTIEVRHLVNFVRLLLPQPEQGGPDDAPMLGGGAGLRACFDLGLDLHRRSSEIRVVDEPTCAMMTIRQAKSDQGKARARVRFPPDLIDAAQQATAAARQEGQERRRAQGPTLGAWAHRLDGSPVSPMDERRTALLCRIALHAHELMVAGCSVDPGLWGEGLPGMGLPDGGLPEDTGANWLDLDTSRVYAGGLAALATPTLSVVVDAAARRFLKVLAGLGWGESVQDTAQRRLVELAQQLDQSDRPLTGYQGALAESIRHGSFDDYDRTEAGVDSYGLLAEALRLDRLSLLDRTAVLERFGRRRGALGDSPGSRRRALLRCRAAALTVELTGGQLSPTEQRRVRQQLDAVRDEMTQLTVQNIF